MTVKLSAHHKSLCDQHYPCSVPRKMRFRCMFHIHILQSFCFPFFVVIYNLSHITDNEKLLGVFLDERKVNNYPHSYPQGARNCA
jgi:hypothetical protein